MPGLLVPPGVLPKPTFQSQGSGSLSLAFPFLNPPPPGRARLQLLRRSAALARLGTSWTEKIVFQEAFKNSLNFNAISTSIFECLGSVLEAQDGSQIDQKSIKIEFPRLSLSASFFT